MQGSQSSTSRGPAVFQIAEETLAGYRLGLGLCLDPCWFCRNFGCFGHGLPSGPHAKPMLPFFGGLKHPPPTFFGAVDRIPTTFL